MFEPNYETDDDFGIYSGYGDAYWINSYGLPTEDQVQSGDVQNSHEDLQDTNRRLSMSLTNELDIIVLEDQRSHNMTPKQSTQSNIIPGQTLDQPSAWPEYQCRRCGLPGHTTDLCASTQGNLLFQSQPSALRKRSREDISLNNNQANRGSEESEIEEPVYLPRPAKWRGRIVENVSFDTIEEAQSNQPPGPIVSICAICREANHSQKNCLTKQPSPNRAGLLRRICYICRHPNHLAPDCLLNKRSPPRKHISTLHNNTHTTYNALPESAPSTLPNTTSSSSTNTCQHCGVLNHDEKHCLLVNPTSAGRFSVGTVECQLCGLANHTARHCALLKSAREHVAPDQPRIIYTSAKSSLRLQFVANVADHSTANSSYSPLRPSMATSFVTPPPPPQIPTSTHSQINLSIESSNTTNNTKVKVHPYRRSKRLQAIYQQAEQNTALSPGWVTSKTTVYTAGGVFDPSTTSEETLIISRTSHVSPKQQHDDNELVNPASPQSITPLESSAEEESESYELVSSKVSSQESSLENTASDLSPSSSESVSEDTSLRAGSAEPDSVKNNSSSALTSQESDVDMDLSDEKSDSEFAEASKPATANNCNAEAPSPVMKEMLVDAAAAERPPPRAPSITRFMEPAMQDLTKVQRYPVKTIPLRKRHRSLSSNSSSSRQKTQIPSQERAVELGRESVSSNHSILQVLSPIHPTPSHSNLAGVGQSRQGPTNTETHSSFTRPPEAHSQTLNLTSNTSSTSQAPKTNTLPSAGQIGFNGGATRPPQDTDQALSQYFELMEREVRQVCKGCGDQFLDFHQCKVKTQVQVQVQAQVQAQVQLQLQAKAQAQAPTQGQGKAPSQSQAQAPPSILKAHISPRPTPIYDPRGNRRWVEKPLTIYPRANGTSFTVATYNVLADSLAQKNMHLYPQYSNRHLNYKLFWGFRGPRIMQEITQLSPDILCLQEVDVDKHNTTFWPILSRAGYFCHYLKRVNAEFRDGCAIYWKKDRVSLEKVDTIKYQHGGRGNVGIVALFRVASDVPHGGRREDSTTRFCVANTHILFNPKRGYLKLAQLQSLFEFMRAFCTYQDPKTGASSLLPAICCGDMNLFPESPLRNYITSQRIRPFLIDERFLSGQFGVNDNNVANPRCDVAAAFLRNLPSIRSAEYQLKARLNFDQAVMNGVGPMPAVIAGSNKEQPADVVIEHAFAFASVMPDRSSWDGFPFYSTHVYGEPGKLVDYIFYTPPKSSNNTSDNKNSSASSNSEPVLQAMGYLSLPIWDPRYHLETPTLPNDLHPSDHFPLLAKFKLEW